MKTLTHREKVLLYILLLIAICALGWFVLLQPSINKQRALKTEYDTIQTTIQSLKLNQKDYSTLNDDSKVALDEYNGLVSRYYGVSLSSEEVDSLFTKMSVDYALTPLDLSIDVTLSDPIIGYGEEVVEDKNKTETPTENKESTNITTKEDQGVFDDKKVFCYEVTQRVRGISTNVYSYIEKINEDEGIRLASVIANQIPQKEGQYEFTLTYYIYLMVK